MGDAMATHSFHVRSRLRMYTAVFIATALTALLIEGFIALTADIRTYADARLTSATQNAIQSEFAQARRR